MNVSGNSPIGALMMTTPQSPRRRSRIARRFIVNLLAVAAPLACRFAHRFAITTIDLLAVALAIDLTTWLLS